MKFRTRAIHVGNERDPQTGAVVPPIHIASTYVQPGAGEWGEFDYSRSGNPTRARLEKTVAELEGGTHGLAYASGMAAIHGTAMLLKPGDHVVAGSDIYGGTYRLLHKVVNEQQVATTLVDSTDLDKVSAAIQPNTKMLWIESPGNPRMTITDIAKCAELAKAHKLLLVVDSTFATPALTRPLEIGANIVIHSATKYLGGHSDALGGVTVVNSKELYDKLYFIQNATGGVMSPWDSFLISRGIKTLDLRVRAQCQSAMKIAEYLSLDERVEQVHFPGLKSHSGHKLAEQQMGGLFGAMLSFEVKGDVETARKVVNSTKLFQLAVSLGAVESLIEQPATMSHASYAKEDREAHGIKDTLVRISVGLEDAEDLIEDLRRALDKK